MTEQANTTILTSDTFSVLAPKSGTFELSAVYHQKVLQLACATAATTVTLPAAILGFNCLLVVATSGNTLTLNASTNSQTLISCLNTSGNSSTTTTNITTPVVGTRIRIRCDGAVWYAYSDYSETLPVANAGSLTLTNLLSGVTADNAILVSPTNLSGYTNSTIALGAATAACVGRVFKLVSGATSTGTSNGILIQGSGNNIRYLTIKNDNETSPAAINSSNASTLTIGNSNTGADDVVIGDSVTITSDGNYWYVCGSSFGKIA